MAKHQNNKHRRKRNLWEEVKDYLGEAGYSEAYGARPLRRLIQKRIEDGLAEEILSGKYIDQYGIDALEINEYGIDYRVNNLGFLQVNNGMKKLMYDRVLECIDSSAEVIDAYSGAGLLSAIVSKKAKTVTGIEINKSASMSAVDLANKNQINNIEFICDDVEKSLGGVLSKINNATIILDPPRSGCSRVVVNKIVEVYVAESFYARFVLYLELFNE